MTKVSVMNQMLMDLPEMKDKKTRSSCAYLVGKVTPKEQSQTKWKDAEKPSADDYKKWCQFYYKSHVDAMMEAKGQEKPDFLKSVKHYIHPVSEPISIEQYKFTIKNLHLYYFPFNIVLLAIEIDDSNNTLNNLTLGHGKLMKWNEIYDIFPDSLKEVLSKLSNSNNLEQLYGDGNKLKLYQIIEIEPCYGADMKALLYELGTSSPIDCVNGNDEMTPSSNYYQEILQQNIVSTFNNWTALALVDSFTYLTDSNSVWDKYSQYWINDYFQLIYLRCIFEKTFCFTRNISYHEDQKNDKLAKEIALMEKYYFYDNISHNFQPNLLYQAMAKGLGIKQERQELFNQIKEEARKDEEARKEREEKRKEREEKRINTILGIVSIFALFSVFSDIGEFVMEAFPDFSRPLVYKIIGVLAVIGFIGFIYLIIKITKRKS